MMLPPWVFRSHPVPRLHTPLGNLTYAATYEITVTVIYTDGTSSASFSIERMTGQKPGDMPAGLLPVSKVQTSVSGNKITVSWTNPEQEEYHRVQYYLG